ncbi:MAG: SCP-like extracellular, partial [Asticcacaulis sp.]|nr:SCP-like extracellular [Asticcacaulis sp.]
MKFIALAVAGLVAMAAPAFASDLSDQVLSVHNRERGEV